MRWLLYLEFPADEDSDYSAAGFTVDVIMDHILRRHRKEWEKQGKGSVADRWVEGNLHD